MLRGYRASVPGSSQRNTSVRPGVPVRVKVEIWSDVVCPWCYIGKRRFETALAAFPHREHVAVTWRSYQLSPDDPVVENPDYTVIFSLTAPLRH